MRILYIVPNPPSLVRVRPYNLIRHLSARGHHITVATVWRGDDERSDIAHLRRQGITVIAAPLSTPRIALNILRAALWGLPLQATYSETPRLHEALRTHWFSASSRPAPYDIIHVEHLRGVRYGLQLGTLLRHAQPEHAPPVVWDSVDCISYLFEQAAKASASRMGRWMARLELGRTRRYEGKLVRSFDRILITSSLDRQALAALNTSGSRASPAPMTVLPNGVDLDYFTPDATPREPALVLFSGKMSYHANVTAALYLVQEIMPLVWRTRPDVQIVLAGKDPPVELRRLAQAHPNVTVTGTVPDLRPYLRTATVAVAPLRYGAGIQNKVLEAMACGAPVVASASAAAGIAATTGKEFLVATDERAFAEHILHLLADPNLQQQLGRAGRKYVEDHHDWEHIAQNLEQIYQMALAQRQRRSQDKRLPKPGM